MQGFELKYRALLRKMTYTPLYLRPETFILAMQDSELCSDDHFGSHFVGNGLYARDSYRSFVTHFHMYRSLVTYLYLFICRSLLTYLYA